MTTPEQIVANQLRNLLERTHDLEDQVKKLQIQLSSSHAPVGGVSNDRFIHPIKITSMSSGNMYATGLVVTSTNSFSTIVDPMFSSLPITVQVPTNVIAPVVNDIMYVYFVSPPTSGPTCYTLMGPGSSGGGKITPAIVTSGINATTYLVDLYENGVSQSKTDSGKTAYLVDQQSFALQVGDNVNVYLSGNKYWISSQRLIEASFGQPIIGALITATNSDGSYTAEQTDGLGPAATATVSGWVGTCYESTRSPYIEPGTPVIVYTIPGSTDKFFVFPAGDDV